MSPIGDTIRHYYRNAPLTEVFDIIDDFFNVWALLSSFLIALAILPLLLPIKEKTRRVFMIMALLSYGGYNIAELCLNCYFLGLPTVYRLDSVLFWFYFVFAYVRNR